MTYHVKLTIQTPSVEYFRGRPVFRLSVTASDPIEMPAEIFLHKRTLVDTKLNKYQEEFVHICSPYELSIYPADSPDSLQNPPFFRKSRFDILLPSIQVYDETVEQVKTQVNTLISLMGQLDLLEVVSNSWSLAVPPMQVMPASAFWLSDTQPKAMRPNATIVNSVNIATISGTLNDQWLGRFYAPLVASTQVGLLLGTSTGKIYLVEFPGSTPVQLRDEGVPVLAVGYDQTAKSVIFGRGTDIHWYTPPSAVPTILAAGGAVSEIATKNLPDFPNGLYWVTDRRAVRRYNPATFLQELLGTVSATTYPVIDDVSLDLAGNALYFLVKSARTIYRFDWLTSTVTAIVKNIDDARAIFFEPVQRKLWWLSANFINTQFVLNRVNLDGTGRVFFTPEVATAASLSLLQVTPEDVYETLGATTTSSTTTTPAP